MLLQADVNEKNILMDGEYIYILYIYIDNNKEKERQRERERKKQTKKQKTETQINRQIDRIQMQPPMRAAARSFCNRNKIHNNFFFPPTHYDLLLLLLYPHCDQHITTPTSSIHPIIVIQTLPPPNSFITDPLTLQQLQQQQQKPK